MYLHCFAMHFLMRKLIISAEFQFFALISFDVLIDVSCWVLSFLSLRAVKDFAFVWGIFNT